jgi:hypothetical protein
MNHLGLAKCQELFLNRRLIVGYVHQNKLVRATAKSREISAFYRMLVFVLTCVRRVQDDVDTHATAAINRTRDGEVCESRLIRREAFTARDP